MVVTRPVNKTECMCKQKKTIATYNLDSLVLVSKIPLGKYFNLLVLINLSKNKNNRHELQVKLKDKTKTGLSYWILLKSFGLTPDNVIPL